MKYKIVEKDGKYRKKTILEWHEKLGIAVLAFADAYILYQIIRHFIA